MGCKKCAGSKCKKFDKCDKKVRIKYTDEYTGTDDKPKKKKKKYVIVDL